MGDGEIALSAAGWYDGNSGQETHPVGMKEPNAYGLYDMHGNVWEWCADAWNENAYKMRVDGVCDPEVTTQSLAGDVLRVIRGGSWNNRARNCRAAYRNRNRPANRNRNQGFRVCLFPGTTADRSGGRRRTARFPVSGVRRISEQNLDKPPVCVEICRAECPPMTEKTCAGAPCLIAVWTPSPSRLLHTGCSGWLV
jgi:hypothetical protein